MQYKIIISEKKDKYLDLARELKKLWNMKVTIVPVVIGALGTITKGLLKGLEVLEVGGRVETIQTTTLLRTARILRRVLETWGDLLSLKLQWKTISWHWCEKRRRRRRRRRNTPKNRRCKPCCNKEVMINHKISECIKKVQKTYKSWLG